jgi:predicted MFS family arabinose efflux permease
VTERTRTWGLVAGLILLSAAAAAYEIAPASVIPLVRETLGVGPTAASGLVSVMYATAALTSVPLGIVLDRIGARRAVTAAGLALLVAGAWGWEAAQSGSYGSLLASRVLGGVAYMVVWNTGATLAGTVVEAEHRATAVGLFTASAPVGFAIGQFGSPLVAARAGWPATLPAFATLGAVGMLVFVVATRDLSLDLDAEAPDRAALVTLFGDRVVWSLAALCLLAFSLYLFLNTWLPSYLVAERDLSLARAGLVTALFPAVGIVARTLSGVVSDRLFGGRRRPVVLAAFVVAAPSVGAIVLAPGLLTVLALLVVAGFAIQVTIALLFTYVAEVVDPSVRTTAVALLTSIGLFGAFAAPLAAGVVIETVGYGPAFLAAAIVAGVGIAIALSTPDRTSGATRHRLSGDADD